MKFLNIYVLFREKVSFNKVPPPQKKINRASALKALNRAVGPVQRFRALLAPFREAYPPLSFFDLGGGGLFSFTVHNFFFSSSFLADYPFKHL
jgi:hypothetical protein